MTFDELWRRDLRRKDPLLCSNETPDEADVFEASAETAFVFIDPDRAEINRYLNWLEKSLLLDAAAEHSTE
jgi:hypothetical protein